MKKFWNFIRDETAPDARVLRLEGTIAEESWFDDDVTPALFKADLNAGSGPITVWINSPGGDCEGGRHRRLCRIGHRHGGNARTHVARVHHDDPQPAHCGHGR